MRLISLCFCAVFLLVACGTRGPLVMPPKPAPENHNSKPAEPTR